MKKLLLKISLLCGCINLHSSFCASNASEFIEQKLNEISKLGPIYIASHREDGNEGKIRPKVLGINTTSNTITHEKLPYLKEIGAEKRIGIPPEFEEFHLFNLVPSREMGYYNIIEQSGFYLTHNTHPELKDIVFDLQDKEQKWARKIADLSISQLGDCDNTQWKITCRKATRIEEYDSYTIQDKINNWIFTAESQCIMLSPGQLNDQHRYCVIGPGMYEPYRNYNPRDIRLFADFVYWTFLHPTEHISGYLTRLDLQIVSVERWVQIFCDVGHFQKASLVIQQHKLEYLWPDVFIKANEKIEKLAKSAINEADETVESQASQIIASFPDASYSMQLQNAYESTKQKAIARRNSLLENPQVAALAGSLQQDFINLMFGDFK